MMSLSASSGLGGKREDADGEVDDFSDNDESSFKDQELLYRNCLLAMQSDKSATPSRAACIGKKIDDPPSAVAAHLDKSATPEQQSLAMQSDDNDFGSCVLIMKSDISATPKFEKSQQAASAVKSSSQNKTFQRSKLNITVNNFASKPILKEVQTTEEMLIDLKAMRESLGLTPINQDYEDENENENVDKNLVVEDEEEEYGDCEGDDNDYILEMRSPDGRKQMQAFSQQVGLNRRECTVATGLTQSCITFERAGATTMLAKKHQ